MQEGTSTLATDGQDTFWYYTTDVGPVSVSTVGGAWQPATPGTDPNGQPGWSVRMIGPEHGAVAGAVALTYGPNKLQVRLADNSIADGGSVYVGPTGLWADIYDPATYSFIITGRANPLAVVTEPIPYEVDQALRIASDTLSSLTANRVHPAGSAVERFTGSWPLHRLTFTHKPVAHIDAVKRIDWAFNETPVTPDEYRQSGQALIFKPVMRNIGGACSGGIGNVLGLGYAGMYGSRFDNDFALSAYSGGVGTETIEVGYRFSSTIGAAARHAVLYYAHQLYLQAVGSDTCALPTRTTSVSREGISFQVDTSETYLSEGRVGLPVVDQFLAASNPSAGVGRYASARANRPSGVWSPDSPPGVVTSYQLSA